MLGCGVIVLAMVFHLCQSASSKDSCQPLNMSYCQALGYNRTIFPNFFGHRLQRLAVHEASQFAPLVAVGCSQDVAFFFCMVYFPVCNILNKAIPPCRSVCLGVRAGCEPLMKKFKYTWPKSLNCNKFPQLGSKELCVARNPSSSSTVLPVKRPPMKKLSLKQRHKVCWGTTHTSKRCCRRGKRAAKMNLTTCSLVNHKYNSRKKNKFLRNVIGKCSSNKVAKECYESCCAYRKREQRNKKRKQKKTRRRQPSST